MIKCEVKLDLSWTKDCVLPENNNNITAVDFKTNSSRIYVSVVKLSINTNINFLENFEQGFKRTISWKKDRYEVITKPEVSNLDHMIDPTFRNINRLLVLLLKNDGNAPKIHFLLSTTWLYLKIKGLKYLVTINCSLKTKT